MWILILAAVLVVVVLKLRRKPLGPSQALRWPVAARRLLSPREQALFQRLRALYPSHWLFIQVALSQLVEVAPEVADMRALRNRFDRLVADFALCRPDFSLAVVIELDDASHGRADRVDADRRKSHAFESAGIPLVRIPAGSLLSDEELKQLIDAKGGGGEATTVVVNASGGPRRQISWGWAALGSLALVLFLSGAVTLLASFGFTLDQHSTRGAHAAAAVTDSEGPQLADESGSQDATTGAVNNRAKAGLDRAPGASALASQQAANELALQKETAWAAFFTPSASCEHPPTSSDRVECGNQYFRAKKAFEAQWNASHPKS